MIRAPRLGLPFLDLALALAVAALWGLNNTVAKHVINHVPPLFFVVGRFAIQGLILMPWMFRAKDRLKPLAIIATLGGPIHFAFLYLGFAATEQISQVAIIVMLWVPFATLIAIPLLGERPSARAWVGLGLSFGGITILGFDPGIINSPLGAILVCGAAVCWASCTVISRKVGGVPAMPLQAWLANLSWPPMLVASLLFEPSAVDDAKAWLAPFLGFCLLSTFMSGVIANALMFKLVKRHPVAKVTPILLLTPVFNIASAVVFLGDTLTSRMIVGGMVTLCGLLLVTLRGDQDDQQAS